MKKFINLSDQDYRRIENSKKNLKKIADNINYGCSLKLMLTKKDWRHLPFIIKKRCFISEINGATFHIYFLSYPLEINNLSSVY